MLESRAAYGYYGEGGGASGEQPKKTHKNGWRIWNFHFDVANYDVNQVVIRACDYAHALKQLKSWAKKDGFTIIGDRKGWESQRNT